MARVIERTSKCDNESLRDERARAANAGNRARASNSIILCAPSFFLYPFFFFFLSFSPFSRHAIADSDSGNRFGNDRLSSSGAFRSARFAILEFSTFRLFVDFNRRTRSWTKIADFAR